MKKIVSLLMCCVFAISVFAVFPQADEAITKDEAAKLITKMNGFHRTLCDTNGDINIHDLGGTEVTDKETHDRLFKLSGLKASDDLVFYLLDGDYAQPLFWYDHIGGFLTEDYIQNNVQFNFAIFELDGKMYRVDSLFFVVTPGKPGLIFDDGSLENHIKIVDNDTVLLEAFYTGTDSATWKEVDFEYTEDGWRISGGEATEDFTRLCSLRDNTANPDTSDNIIVIVVCATAALVIIALTVNKRRFAR